MKVAVRSDVTLNPSVRNAADSDMQVSEQAGSVFAKWCRSATAPARHKAKLQKPALMRRMIGPWICVRARFRVYSRSVTQK